MCAKLEAGQSCGEAHTIVEYGKLHRPLRSIGSYFETERTTARKPCSQLDFRACGDRAQLASRRIALATTSGSVMYMLCTACGVSMKR